MNVFGSMKLKDAVAVGLIGFGALTYAAARADNAVRVLDFETHAAFFSDEMHIKTPLDPQVFVAAPAAPAAVGPQGVKHIDGVRNALIADASGLPIVAASGKPMDMSLGAWLGAKGKAVLTPLPDGREKVAVLLSGLKPNGRYSLFENHFDQKPVGFTPLDGNGADNDFVADAQGKAVVTMVSPAAITHDNGILLVYHSDGKSHGKVRGDIGVNAHHQLIIRP